MMVLLCTATLILPGEMEVSIGTVPPQASTIVIAVTLGVILVAVLVLVWLNARRR